MRARKGAVPYERLAAPQKAAIDAEVAMDLKTNRYNDAAGTLRIHTVAGGRVGRHRTRNTARYSPRGEPGRALPPKALCCRRKAAGSDAMPAAKKLAAFVTWTAWLSAAKRPDATHSYTNNWPYDKAAGNTATAGAMMWSAASVAGLLMFLALILFLQHRYQLTAQDVPNPKLSLRHCLASR